MTSGVVLQELRMDTSIPQKPRTVAELMPELSGIMTIEARQAFTAIKKPRPTRATTRTTEKPYKPLSLADLQVCFPSSKKTAQPPPSTKKGWNSSVKVKKTVSHTENNKIKNNPVRKVLNFQQPKPKISTMTTSNGRMTMIPPASKFTKPEIKVKKSLHPLAEEKASNTRISGVCRIAQTPVLVNKPKKIEMTTANKENISCQPSPKIIKTPKSSLRKRIMASHIPDTPLSNVSWKSSCDDSFIQNEKEIELIENKAKVLTESNTFQTLAKVSPSVSTPYKEYRDVNEIFNSSSINSSTAYQDNTIMCFDTASVSNVNNKREESVIVSLCDMLHKATVSTTETKKPSTDLDNLLEVEKRTVTNLEMIENGIKLLNSVKESELKSLQSVRQLINEKQNGSSDVIRKTIIETTKQISICEELTPIKSQVVAKPCSVIKSCLKSPSYKIPKRLNSVKKKVHYRSLPNVSNLKLTPEIDMGDRAKSVYLKMKEHMNFLSTPARKHPTNAVMDTPTIASHNLQKQLDKLYNNS